MFTGAHRRLSLDRSEAVLVSVDNDLVKLALR